MIKHIVCYKLKDNSQYNCEKTKEILLSMKNKIPEIIELNVGIDFLKSERSYDLVLEVMFSNSENMEKYQRNQYHVEIVKKHMHQVKLSSVSVDYLID